MSSLCIHRMSHAARFPCPACLASIDKRCSMGLGPTPVTQCPVVPAARPAYRVHRWDPKQPGSSLFCFSNLFWHIGSCFYMVPCSLYLRLYQPKRQAARRHTSYATHRGGCTWFLIWMLQVESLCNLETQIVSLTSSTHMFRLCCCNCSATISNTN